MLFLRPIRVIPIVLVMFFPSIVSAQFYQGYDKPCPEGSTRSWYWGGVDMYFGKCVLNAQDFGEVCEQNSDCSTKHCTVTDDSLNSDMCIKDSSNSYTCPGLKGSCAATSQVGVATLLDQKDKVRVYVYQ